MRGRTALVVGAAGTVATMLIGAFGCLSDPREGEEVTVITECDESLLSSDPTNPQSSLKAYLAATNELNMRAQAVAAELRDACKALDAELGLPTGDTSADLASALVAACSPILARVEAVSKLDPTLAGHPPGSPYFAELRFPPNCTKQTDALAQCIASCAPGGCDATKCDENAITSKCAGECQGRCITTGQDIPCNGQCIGVTEYQQPATCIGECEGICTSAGNWGGECGGACGARFDGKCAGTCTGTCDGVPINQDQDAGPPPAPGLPPKPPDNAPGNCPGFCVGACSSGSNGQCRGVPCFNYSPDGGPPPVTPAPYRGYCLGTCGGTCRSALGTGTTSPCTGECTEARTDCQGLCRGKCNGTMTEQTCEVLRCGQNTECENACQARFRLATQCDLPPFVEAYAVTDPAFVAAWKKHGPAIGKAVMQIKLLREAYGFIGDRAYGDFVALGLTGDLPRACVSKGTANVAAANTLIQALLNANPTERHL